MEQLAGQLSFALLNGLVWGWILALVTLGLQLIYANLRWLNLSHGAFYMLGGMLVWKIATSIGFWLALPAAGLLAGATGVLAERVIFRPIRDARSLLLAAIGLMLVLQQMAVLAFGGAPQAVANPLSGSISFLGKQFPLYWLVAAALAGLLLTAIWLLLKFSRVGLWMRAVGQDRQLAASLGIPVSSVNTLTFALSTALAALAGGLIAPMIGVHPLMGLEILVMALIVVIVGKSTWGAAGVAMLASLLENMLPVITPMVLAQSISPSLSRIFILALLMSVLLIRSVNNEAARDA